MWTKPSGGIGLRPRPPANGWEPFGLQRNKSQQHPKGLGAQPDTPGRIAHLCTCNRSEHIPSRRHDDRPAQQGMYSALFGGLNQGDDRGSRSAGKKGRKQASFAPPRGYSYCRLPAAWQLRFAAAEQKVAFIPLSGQMSLAGVPRPSKTQPTPTVRSDPDSKKEQLLSQNSFN